LKIRKTEELDGTDRLRTENRQPEADCWRLQPQ